MNNDQQLEVIEKEDEIIGPIFLNGFQIEQLASLAGFKVESSNKYYDPYYEREWAIIQNKNGSLTASFISSKINVDENNKDLMMVEIDLDSPESEFTELQIVD